MGLNKVSPFCIFILLELKFKLSFIICFKTDLTGKESFIVHFTGKAGFKSCYF